MDFFLKKKKKIPIHLRDNKMNFNPKEILFQKNQLLDLPHTTGADGLPKGVSISFTTTSSNKSYSKLFKKDQKHTTKNVFFLLKHKSQIHQ